MKRILLALVAVLLFPHLSAQEEELLSLEQAWKIALRNSPSEEAARSRLTQAEARLGQSRSLWQPRVDASASGTRIDYSDSSRAGIPDAADADERFEAALEASWLLYNGNSRDAGVQAARFGRDAAFSDLEDVRLQLLANVGLAFTSAQLARENLRIAVADAEFQNRQSEEAALREQAGVASRADRLNFDIRRLSAETAAITAQADFDTAMAALAVLLGQGAITQQLPPPERLDIDAKAPPAPEFPQAWLATKERLPALVAARALYEAAEQQLRAVKGQYQPTLSAFGNLQAQREENPNFADDDVGSTIGLRIAIPVWEGNNRRELVAEAESSVEEASALLRQLELQAEAELSRTASDYLASVEAERITRESLELSRENRDLVEASYRAGRESLLRLNEAQRDFTTAEARAAQARLTREQFWIELQKSLGTLKVEEP